MKANNFWEVKTYLTFKLRHDGLTPHMTCQPLDNKNNFLVRSADYVKEIIFLVGLKSVWCKMNMSLGYFVSVVVVGHWFRALVIWRQVSKVVLWSRGWCWVAVLQWSGDVFWFVVRWGSSSTILILDSGVFLIFLCLVSICGKGFPLLFSLFFSIWGWTYLNLYWTKMINVWFIGFIVTVSEKDKSP